jgi:septal ring factor EnvC (AmiA/AmiB activator)
MLTILMPSGTDEELEARLRNFDGHIIQQKQKKGKEESKRQDLEDELASARKQHVALVSEHGRLTSEAKVRFNAPRCQRIDLICVTGPRAAHV